MKKLDLVCRECTKKLVDSGKAEGLYQLALPLGDTPCLLNVEFTVPKDWKNQIPEHIHDRISKAFAQALYIVAQKLEPVAGQLQIHVQSRAINYGQQTHS
jgi:hypothetical protein